MVVNETNIKYGIQYSQKHTTNENSQKPALIIQNPFVLSVQRPIRTSSWSSCLASPSRQKQRAEHKFFQLCIMRTEWLLTPNMKLYGNLEPSMWLRQLNMASQYQATFGARFNGIVPRVEIVAQQQQWCWRRECLSFQACLPVSLNFREHIHSSGFLSFWLQDHFLSISSLH